jgi:hypothetical protein
MARTDIPVQILPAGGSIDSITWTAADLANGHSFQNDGHTILLAKCTDASGKTITVRAVADSEGRSVDKAIAILATTGFSVAGPFKPANWNQSAVIGTVNVDVSAATGLSLAAVRYTPVVQ